MVWDSLFHSPYLLPKVEPDPYYVGEHIIASSSKLIVIDKILKDILPKGEKVLIFSVGQLLILSVLGLMNVFVFSAMDRVNIYVFDSMSSWLSFSSFCDRMLDVLEDMMHLRDIKYARLDGSTPRPRRSLDIKLVCTTFYYQ